MASENNWLQMMAVLRVEEADAATFKDIFTQAVHRVKKIKGSENVRWYELMRILVTWVYWRRPKGEGPSLLAEAEQAQSTSKRLGEVRQMTSKLGPSYIDEARMQGEERGQLKSARDILKTLLQDRFNRLPKKLQKQIDAADDVEHLRQAIRRVHDSRSLGDFEF